MTNVLKKFKMLKNKFKNEPLYGVGKDEMEKLPVLEKKDEILDSVKKNAVTIITAETGAGKSTQVPQFLLEAGYYVVTTEPRRLAASTLSQRVAEEMNLELGSTVGFKTGFESSVSKETRLLYCTDGLQLVKELTEKKSTVNKVLVIDEVHEWNNNIETLVGWSKKQLDEGWETKIVLMSATIDSEALRSYFGEERTNIISVSGRVFPVTEIKGIFDIQTAIELLYYKGKNTLVFLPGKKEIEMLIGDLERANLDAVILPLHGELTPDEQRKAFKRYDKPKIVIATNVAQTSITIPDIDGVVDSGLERRIESANGIEGLYLRDISKADCLQRKGRAGRVKEGLYILCSEREIDSREQFPIPEIQRVLLDQVVLKLASVSIDATEISFFHQPENNAIEASKLVLQALGALDEKGKITPIGCKMSKLPLSARSAKMLTTAERLGVVEEVMRISAILEVGSLLSRNNSSGYASHTKESTSDLLAELDVYNKISKTSKIDFEKEGIFKKNFFRVKEYVEKLYSSLSGFNFSSSPNNKRAIKQAIISGFVDCLFMQTSMGYSDCSNTRAYRRLDRKSCLKNPSFVLGIPKNIEFQTRNGYRETLSLISMATEISITEMLEVAPLHLIEVIEGADPYYYEEGDKCYSYTYIMYRGNELIHFRVETPYHPHTNKNIEQQQFIECGGKSFNICYPWKYRSDDAFIEISQKEILQIKEDNLFLNDGTLLNVKCNAISSTSISELRDELEKVEIGRAFNAKKKNLPTLKSNCNISDISKHLGKIKIYERGNNEDVFAYVYLAIVKNKAKLHLHSEKEVADEVTANSLKNLFRKDVSNMSKGFLNNTNKDLLELFNSFVDDALSELDLNNYLDKLEHIGNILFELGYSQE